MPQLLQFLRMLWALLLRLLGQSSFLPPAQDPTPTPNVPAPIDLTPEPTAPPSPPTPVEPPPMPPVQIVETRDIDAGFEPALFILARALNVPPLGLAMLLFSESDLRPRARNGLCVGINQMCPGTLEGYVNPAGIKPGQKDVPSSLYSQNADAYQAMSASEQMRAGVAPLWTSRARQYGGVDSPEDVYWLNFFPATYKRGLPTTAVVTDAAWAIQDNPSLANGKSYITKGDLGTAMRRATTRDPKRWAEVAARVNAYAAAGRPGPGTGAAVGIAAILIAAIAAAHRS